MEIIGRGFLAQNLADAFGDRYRYVTALAAGVSSTAATAAEEMDREAELVYRTLRRCRAENRTLIFFSTASFGMYGTTTVPAPETGPLYPPTVYGRHKLALEASIRSAAVDFLILRLSHLVGPYQRPHQLLPAIVRQVGTGAVTVHRGAHRDLLDIDDLMHAIDRMLANGVHRQVVNVASGLPLPIEAILDGIEQRLDVHAERVYMNTAVTRALVSVERLHRLVPDLGQPGTGPSYLDRLLDRYLPLYDGVRNG